MMMYQFVFLMLLCSSAFGEKVRNVEVKDDQIVTVRTSLGIATIIQVPDRPNSVVVGDQDSFKVEYLDQAITIKPLSNSARSNLYVYTDWKRYNVELVTGSQEVADYVVYLKSPKKKKSDDLRWKKSNNFLRNGDFKLSLIRVGNFQDKLFLIEFEVKTEKNMEFKPEWIWLTQNGEQRPIWNLVLSDLSLKKGKVMKGLIQVQKSEVNGMHLLKLEVRRDRVSFLTLPKVIPWI
jgi:hypothetical protein